MITPRGQILVCRTGMPPCVFCVVRLCIVRFAFVRCALSVLLVCYVWVLACVLVCHADPHPSPRVYVQDAPPVSTLKTSPCVPAPRPQVLPHAGVVRTHGDVLNVDTARTHRDHNHSHNTTRQQHTTSHGDRDRDRLREDEREETRQESKRR